MLPCFSDFFKTFFKLVLQKIATISNWKIPPSLVLGMPYVTVLL